MVRQALWVALGGGLLLVRGDAVRRDGLPPDRRGSGGDSGRRGVSVGHERRPRAGSSAYFVLRNLCDGMSWTTPAMVVALSGLALKVPLNYLLRLRGTRRPRHGRSRVRRVGRHRHVVRIPRDDRRGAVLPGAAGRRVLPFLRTGPARHLAPHAARAADRHRHLLRSGGVLGGDAPDRPPRRRGGRLAPGRVERRRDHLHGAPGARHGRHDPEWATRWAPTTCRARAARPSWPWARPRCSRSWRPGFSFGCATRSSAPTRPTRRSSTSRRACSCSSRSTSSWTTPRSPPWAPCGATRTSGRRCSPRWSPTGRSPCLSGPPWDSARSGLRGGSEGFWVGLVVGLAVASVVLLARLGWRVPERTADPDVRAGVIGARRHFPSSLPSHRSTASLPPPERSSGTNMNR